MPKRPSTQNARSLFAKRLPRSLAAIVSGILPATLPAITFSELMAPMPGPSPTAYAAEAGQSFLRFAPEDLQPGEARPAMVLIHGGGWSGGSPDIFVPHAKYFASRGMVAFSIGYRLIKPGGPGLKDCIDDCQAALAYIHKHAAELGVDPARIVVMGDSAGGHLAAVLSTTPGSSPQPAAAVLCNPIVDLTDPAWVRFAIGGPAPEKNAPRLTVMPDAAQEEQAKALSPLFHVRPGLPPTLIMHGTNDHVVDPEQVKKYSRAMEDAGNTCRLHLIDGARHAFIVPRYTAPEGLVVETVREADAFLAGLGILQGEPTLVPSVPPAWEVSSAKKPSKP